jgi:hypothetical protein
MVLEKSEIFEGNKLISKFMGISDKIESAYELGGLGYDGCRYIESWDWLFGVINKINGLGKSHNFSIHKKYVSLSVEDSSKFSKSFKFAYSEYITPLQSGKEATFKLIVRYIKWYNETM